MKKLIAPFLAAGIATSAQAQEPQRDSVLFWDTTGYGVVLDYFAGELDQYKGRYNGNLIAVFGLHVGGAYDKLKWDMQPCSLLLQDQGVAVKERLQREFSDEKNVLTHHWLEKKNVKALDTPSILKSIDKAVDKAVDACAPKIM